MKDSKVVHLLPAGGDPTPPPEKRRGNLNFPKTVAACKTAQKSLWAIGDALVKECPLGIRGHKDGSTDRIKECAQEVAEQCGVDMYGLQMLRKLRTVSAAFPDGTRVPSISWAVHRSAGDKNTLNGLVEAAKKEDKPLTTSYANKQLKTAKTKAKRRAGTALHTSYEKILDAQIAAGDMGKQAMTIIEEIAERLPDEGVEKLLEMCDQIVNKWNEVAKTLRSRGEAMPPGDKGKERAVKLVADKYIKEAKKEEG
jgi:hypothetical protein